MIFLKESLILCSEFFSCWIFSTLTFACVIRLRRIHPEWERTYQVPLYPLIPLLAIGSGLYTMALLCLIILIICMEAMHFYTFKLGERQVSVTMKAQSQKDIEAVVTTLGKRVSHCSWNKDGDIYKASFSLLIRKREYPAGVLKYFHDIPGVELTSMD